MPPSATPHPRPRPLRRALWLAALFTLAGLLSVGTSKTLSGKKLVSPRPQSPPTVALEGAPEAWLAENVNNQGCFSEQVLDFSARIPLRNTSDAPLQVSPREVTLRIDGRTLPVHRAQFLYPLAPAEQRRYGARLPPGGKGELFVTASAILPKARLETVKHARLRVALGEGTLKLEFPDIRDQPVTRRGAR